MATRLKRLVLVTIASTAIVAGMVSPATAVPVDADLALTGVPADITITSTLPFVVSYTPPTAVDEEPGAAVSCTPASGSTFPVGTTKVTCTATDADDTNSPVSASFNVNIVLPTGAGGGATTGVPPGASALAISPTTGPPLTTIGVASVTPCPIGSSSALVLLRNPLGTALAVGPATLLANDSWSGNVTVPAGTPAGPLQVLAVCYLGTTPLVSYFPALFDVTSVVPAVQHHHRHRHRHHH